MAIHSACLVSMLAPLLPARCAHRWPCSKCFGDTFSPPVFSLHWIRFDLKSSREKEWDKFKSEQASWHPSFWKRPKVA
eukprot:1143245-Pelagomonas_calceolata.AAC.4